MKTLLEYSLWAIAKGRTAEFATNLVEQGVPLAKISGLLGHSSVNTTFEYYCDVIEQISEFLA